MPEYVAVFLHAVRILLGYGRHLLATVERRATAPTFPTIAAAFGTANLSTILAHLHRGILRATALERFLRERATTGRDISIVTRRTRTTRRHRDARSPAASRRSFRSVGGTDPRAGRSHTVYSHLPRRPVRARSVEVPPTSIPIFSMRRTRCGGGTGAGQAPSPFRLPQGEGEEF